MPEARRGHRAAPHQRLPNGQRTVFTWFGTNNDVRLDSIHHLDAQLSTLSAFNYTYDAEGQIATWTQQAGNVSTNVYSLGYDRAGQLLDGVLRQAGPAGALVKRYAYAYDAAGNRTGEQVDAAPAAEVPNNLNQLVSRSGGGPVRFAGNVSETGAVMVAGGAAVMSGGTNFSGGAVVGIGTNLVSVSATDENGNAATNVYSLVVTNAVAARTLAYDLNGNLTNDASASVTNRYEWDAANRLVRITWLSAETPAARRVTTSCTEGTFRS